MGKNHSSQWQSCFDIMAKDGDREVTNENLILIAQHFLPLNVPKNNGWLK